MARSIWKGEIAFGLVNIPVSLTSAEQRPDIQLHMVDSSNHARIRYERVNADTGEEVPWDRMVKAYEHDNGKFILLTDEDLKVVQPKLTKTIEISGFVQLDEIDPILFDKPYYLEPDKRGKKAYVLLREALRKTGKAGISKVVIRTREYLSALFVRDEALLLMLLRFPQEIRSPKQLEVPPLEDSEFQPGKKEMSLAERLIEEMTEDWNPKQYHDDYREALMEYIEKKVSKGDAVDDVIQSGDDSSDSEEGKVLDLAAYLERSFKNPKAKRSATASKKPAKKAAKKKTNATKKTTQKTRTKSGRKTA